MRITSLKPSPGEHRVMSLVHQAHEYDTCGICTDAVCASEGPSSSSNSSISGLVVEYIVAIDVTRVRFSADAHSLAVRELIVMFWLAWTHRRMPVHPAASITVASIELSNMDALGIEPRALRMRSGCDITTPRAPAMLVRHGINRSQCAHGRQHRSYWQSGLMHAISSSSSSSG